MEKKPSGEDRKVKRPEDKRQNNNRPVGKRPADRPVQKGKSKTPPSHPTQSRQNGRPVSAKKNAPEAGKKKRPAETPVREKTSEKRAASGKTQYRPAKKAVRNKPPEETTGGKLIRKAPAKKRPMKQQEADDAAEEVLIKDNNDDQDYDAHQPLEPPKKPDSPYIRKLKKILLAFVTIVILLGICTALSFTVFFKIDQITVQGKTRYNSDEIIAASEINTGDNLLLCNTSPGCDKIKDKFPYIENVSIEKHLFNQINIKVTEAKPTSIIESDGKYIVLGKSGKIIEINDKKLYDVPAVLGAKLENVRLSSTIKYKDSNLKKYLDRVIEAIDTNGLKDSIITVDISNTSNIALFKKNGFKIIIGNFENVDYKLKTAAHILSTSVNDHMLGTLDVSLASSEGGKSYLKITGDTEEIARKAAEEKKKKEEAEKKKKEQQEAEKKKAEEAAQNQENSENTDDAASDENTDGTLSDSTENTDDLNTTAEDNTTEDYQDYGTVDYGDNYTDDGTYVDSYTTDDGLTDSDNYTDDYTTDDYTPDDTYTGDDTYTNYDTDDTTGDDDTTDDYTADDQTTDYTYDTYDTYDGYDTNYSEE